MFYRDMTATSPDIDFLTTIDIFSDLTAEQLALFGPAIETQIFAGGDTLFNENDMGDCLYIIKEGKVSMRFSLKVNTGTIRPIVLTAEKNDFFGEFAFIDSSPRTATAIAEKDTVLIKMDRDSFYDVIERNPALGYVVMKNFSRFLTARNRHINQQLQTALLMGWNAYKFDKY
jgi:CRP-like cAMP-binding protein